MFALPQSRRATDASFQAAETRCNATANQTSGHRYTKHRAKHYVQRPQNTGGFLLVLTLTVSMMLSLVPSIAWAEIVDNYATVGGIVSEQLNGIAINDAPAPAEDPNATDNTVLSGDTAANAPSNTADNGDNAAATSVSGAANGGVVPEAVPAVESNDTNTFTYTDNDIKVTATLANPGSLPADAEFEVEAINPNEPSYREYLQTANGVTSGELTQDNTLLYDVHFVATVDGEQREVEPDGPVTVRFDFNQDQLSEGIDATNSNDVQVTHLLDNGAVELMNADVNVAAETGETDVASFTTTSFSVFAFSYTVDVTYNDITYSFPGKGSYALADVLAAVGIESAVDGASLELVEGEAKEGELYLTQPDGVWYLNSDVAFSSTYELTVTSGDATYAIVVTDAEPLIESDLTNFLTGFSITGLEPDENGDYTVTDGETYTINMNFGESYIRQFANDQELTYTLPKGFKINEAVNNGTMTITVDHDGTTANVQASYTIDTDGNVKIKFSQADEDAYKLLSAASNVKFRLTYEAEFDKDAANDGEIDLVDRTIKIEDEVLGNAYPYKSGELNRETGQMEYTITIRADEGKIANATVTDQITGNALTLDQSSIKINSSMRGDISADSETITGEGFTYTFNSIKKGEVITITYAADVDYSKDSDSDGMLTAEQVGNTVTLKPEDKDEHSGNFNQSITYATTGKTAGDISETDGGKRTLEWVITYNADALAPAAGHTISDSISNETISGTSLTSQDVMTYDGNGITVVVKDASGNEVGTVTVPQSGLSGTSDSAWTYTIPDTFTTDSGSTLDNTANNYVYEIHYNTTVDMDKVNQTGNVVTVKNEANNTSATKGIEPDDSITVDKEVDNIDLEQNTITWKATITVPASGLSSAVITDSLPSSWVAGGVKDTLKEGSVQVDWTPQSGEHYVLDTSDAEKVIITFYKSDGTSEPGLKASSDDQPRTITVTLTTNINEAWRKAGDTEGGEALKHTNTINMNGVVDTATAILGNPGIQKLGSAYPTTNPETGARTIKYELILTGVTTDTVTVKDFFDTSMLHVSGESIYDHLKIYGGNQYYQGEGGTDVSCTEITENEGTDDEKSGIELTATVPKDNGAYYSHYRIVYYLDVNNDVDLMDLAIENGGSYDLKNTAEWSGKTSDFTYTTVYDYLNKQQVGETASTTTSPDGTETNSTVNSSTVGATTDDSGKTVLNRMAEYQITINPNKATLNEGKPTPLVDTLSANLAIDPTTVSIVAIDKDGNDVSTQVAYKMDYATDGSGDTLVTYTIPDETSVTITYKARVLGNGTVNFSNKASINDRTETVSSRANMGSSSEGESSLVNLTVLKVDGDDQNKVLPNVWFRFYAADNRSFYDDETITDLYYKTDENGQFVISGSHPETLESKDMNGNPQRQDVAPRIFSGLTYYLEEVNPPTGYQRMDYPYSFVFVENSADVSHAGIGGSYRYYMIDSAFVENWPYAGLVIQKDVVGETANPNAEYEFKVEILDAGGSVDVTYPNDSISVSGSSFSYRSATASDSSDYFTFSGGVCTFKLKDGEQFRFFGLPEGTRYRVTETSLDGTMSVSYGVTDANGGDIDTGSQTGSVYTDAIPEGGVAVVTATNTQMGSLLLSKRVTVDGVATTGTLADGTYEFTIAGPTTTNESGAEVAIAGVTQVSKAVGFTIENGVISGATIDGTAAVVNDDGYVEVTGLHPGNYTITETTPTNGASLAEITGGVDGSTDTNAGSVLVTVAAGESGTDVSDEGKAQFTNNLTTAELTLSKEVVSDAAADASQTFTFTVSLFQNEAMDTAASIPAGTYGGMTFSATGVATVTIQDGQSVTATGLPDGLYYKIEETAVTGFTTTGTVTDGTADAASFTGQTATGKIDGESTVAFTNTRQVGGFTVEKTVSSSLEADKDTEFSFTVTLGDTDITGEFGTKTSGGSSSAISFTNGVATFTLKDGDSAAFSNLPVDVTYTVTETTATGFTTTWSAPTGDTSVSANANNATGTVVSGGNPTITATNTRQTGSLTVGKTTVSANSDHLAEKFEFEITLTGAGGNLSGNFTMSGTHLSGVNTLSFTSGKSTKFELTNGQTVTISGLPTGIGYTVTETNTSTSYVTTYSGETGTITADTTLDASITNVHNAGGLTVTKTVQSASDSDKDEAFTFAITLSPGNTSDNLEHYAGQVHVRVPKSGGGFDYIPFTYNSTTYTIESDEFQLKSGQVAVVVEKGATSDDDIIDAAIPAGYGYTVTETDATGYTTTKSGDTGTIETNKTSVAAFTNTRLGSLMLTKLVTVNGVAPSADDGTLKLADGAYEFEVVGPTGDSATSTKRTVTINVEDGVMKADASAAGLAAGEVIDSVAGTSSTNGYALLSNLTPGTYTVQEKSGDNADVALDTNTYTVEVAAGANATSGTTAAAPHVTITNNRGAGSLTVKKQVVSPLASDSTEKFTFTVTLYTDETMTTLYEVGTSTTPAQFGRMEFVNGAATFELANGESLNATGLPVGLYYKIEEGSNSDFTLTGITGDATTTISTDTETATASGSISSSASTVTYTNTRNTGGFSVKKQVVTNPSATTSREYNFTVTLYTDEDMKTIASDIRGTFSTDASSSTVSFTNGVATFKLTDTQTAIIDGLPTGLYYKVEEASSAEYTTSWTDGTTPGTQTGEITSTSSSTTITATNAETGSLLLSKAVTVDGVTAKGSQADGTYSFNVVGPVGDASSTTTPVTITITNGQINRGTVNGSDATIRTVNGIRYIELSNLKYGDYTISEVEPTNDTTLTTIKDKSGTNANVSADAKATVTVSPGYRGADAVTVGSAIFTNDLQTGALELTKLVTVNSASTTGTAADGEYVFRLSGPTGSASATIRTITITIVNGKASSATVDGKSQTLTSDGYLQIAGLTPGEYTITETSSPTPVETIPTKIEVAAGDSQTASNAQATIKIQSNDAASAHKTVYTNNATTGSLLLTKAVYITGEPAASGDTRADGTYSFTVTGPTDVSGATQTTHTVTITISGGEVIGGEVDDMRVLPLSNGYIEIPNLVPGSYTITEAAPTNGTMFYGVSGGTTSPAAVTNRTTTALVTENKTGTSVETTGKVTFTNNINFGSLSVTKRVDSDYAKDKTAEFAFEVELVGATDINGKYGEMTFRNGVATFTLKDGQTITATDLPIGTQYIVRETEVDGISTTVTYQRGTILAEEESVATFTNTRGVGSITLTKQVTVDGEPTTGTLADGTYTFELVGPGTGSYISKTYVDLTITNGEATTVTKTDLPTGTYTVREVASSNPHVALDTQTYTVVVEANDPATVIPELSITNKVTLGNLEVSKTVTSSDKGDANTEFGFTVTLADTTINGTFGDMTFANGVATFTLKDGESVVAEGLPSGIKYTVEETKLPENYTEGKHEGATGTIAAGKTVTAAMKNAYTPGTPGHEKPSTPVAGAIPRLGDTTSRTLPIFLLGAGVFLASFGVMLRRGRKRLQLEFAPSPTPGPAAPPKRRGAHLRSRSADASAPTGRHLRQ